MKSVRIIPRLDIKGPNVVKGIHLEGLRVLGRPEEFAKYYYEAGADELMFVDVVASLYERNSLKEIISATAQEIFIPLTVGGGLRSLDDIKEVLRAGADKVSLNTAAIKNPDIIRQASLEFGASTIVVTIEAIKGEDGRNLAYTDNGRDYTGIEVIDWAQQVEDLGAGEVVITSVDREGTGEGYEYELTEKVARSLSIPVIAHGGAAKKEDVLKVIKDGKADAVTLASILHYEYVAGKEHEGNSNGEGNTEFLKSNRSFHNFKTIELNVLKDYLIENGIICRPGGLSNE